MTLLSANYSDLPGWKDDRQQEALAAFSKSCERILKKPQEQAFGPDPVFGTYGEWQPACKALPSATAKPEDVREYFEEWFRPWKAFAGEEGRGLFTGYYEAALNGSKEKTGPFQYPLYRRPPDLVMVDLGDFREELKGQRIAGRVIGSRLKPYEDRMQIEMGVLEKRVQEPLILMWVDNPVDAFFLHIQGSGRVNMTDGSVMRVGYDGQNGHPYYAIGRELVARGALTKDEVSMQSIRKWLEENPEEAPSVMNTNHSYVFFRSLDQEGPLGGEGVVLTPGRSLAVDRSLIAYGIPFWVDLSAPVPKESGDRVQRLMVAQDTGGAIRGPVRGDVFWGHGQEAEYRAGHMKSEGYYWMLLPKTLDVAVSGT